MFENQEKTRRALPHSKEREAPAVPDISQNRPAETEWYDENQKRIKTVLFLALSEDLSVCKQDREDKYFMCRNIKPLFNFEPAATEDEIYAAALQFVRKISGFHTPSKANEAAFSTAVEEVARISAQLLDSLESNARPKNREEEAEKARERNAHRFAR